MALSLEWRKEYVYHAGDEDIPADMPKEIIQHGKVETVYARVTSVDGGKEGMLILLTFFTPDKSTIRGIKKHRFVPNLNGDNFIAQAYQYLKTLPEYTGAQDC